MGSSDPLDCFNAWKKSPPHNAIMLQPSLEQDRIGMANELRDGTVQVAERCPA